MILPQKSSLILTRTGGEKARKAYNSDIHSVVNMQKRLEFSYPEYKSSPQNAKNQGPNGGKRDSDCLHRKGSCEDSGGNVASIYANLRLKKVGKHL